MRFYLLTIMCLLAIGCNSDPNCRRETALLRSEILDLEDKYYLLKSERDALAQGQGFVQDPVYTDSQPILGTPIQGTPIPGAPIQRNPIPIQGFLLGNQTYEQSYGETIAHGEAMAYREGISYGDGIPYDEGILYDDGIPYADGIPYDDGIPIDGQSHYLDTGEPYYGQPTYASAPTAYPYGDPDIIYENDSRFHNEVVGGDTIYAHPPTLAPTQVQPTLAQPTLAQPPAGQSKLAQSTLAQLTTAQPTLDQSESRLAPDDSILPLDSVIEMEPGSDFEDFDLHPDLSSEASSQESDLLLEAPSDIEVGYGQSSTVQEITEVVINRLATKGHDIDGIPGDEGLDLLIQPRSADGQVQLIPGELTVSVIDPTQPTAQQRIGLWKFIESETELFFANNELGSYGILLHLPWDQETPVNKKLMVHVRFVPASGETFKTVAEIRIDPPQSNYSPEDPLVTGWTRSDKRWDTELGSSSTRSRSTGSGSSASDWIRRRDSSPVRAQVQTTIQPPQTPRRRLQAIPAKATISKPAWRPTR